MSNNVAFGIVVNRARQIQSHAISMVQPSNINVPTSVLVYADNTIKHLSAQNEALMKELVELRAIASVAKVHYGQHRPEAGFEA